MRRPDFSEFLAPLPLAAVAVMVVNDRWLKPGFHNVLTGKLSDFAICFFLPLYLSALMSLATGASREVRLTIGALATAAVFVALKVSQAAAGAWCDILDPVTRPLGFGNCVAVADATDLVALPMIAVGLATTFRRARAAALPREEEP